MTRPAPDESSGPFRRHSFSIKLVGAALTAAAFLIEVMGVRVSARAHLPDSSLWVGVPGVLVFATSVGGLVTIVVQRLHDRAPLKDLLLFSVVVGGTAAVPSVFVDPSPAVWAIALALLLATSAFARTALDRLAGGQGERDRRLIAGTPPADHMLVAAITSVVLGGSLIATGDMRIAIEFSRPDDGAAVVAVTTSTTSTESTSTSSTKPSSPVIPSDPDVAPVEPADSDPDGCLNSPGSGAPDDVAEKMRVASEAGADEAWGCPGPVRLALEGSYVQSYAQYEALLVGSELGAGVIGQPSLGVLERSRGGITYAHLDGQLLNRIQCLARSADIQPVVDADGVVVLVLGRYEKRVQQASGAWGAAEPLVVPDRMVSAYAHWMLDNDGLLFPIAEAQVSDDGSMSQEFVYPNDPGVTITLRESPSPIPQSFSAAYLFVKCGGSRAAVPAYLLTG